MLKLLILVFLCISSFAQAKENSTKEKDVNPQELSKEDKGQSIKQNDSQDDVTNIAKPYMGFNASIQLVFERTWRFSQEIKNPSMMLFHPTRPYIAFISTSSGFIYSLHKNSKGNIEKRTIVNLSKFVNEFKINVSGVTEEGGLIGMVLDPNFITNGYIYLYFTSTGNSFQGILCRLRINPLLPREINFLKRADFLFDVIYTRKDSAGKGMVFGPDGYLYLAVGSSSDYKYSKLKKIEEENIAVSKKNLLGKILRIDVNTPSHFLQYSVPSGNPFNNKEAQTKDYRPEVYAYGFHNPISLSFDQDTYELYVLDSGSGLMDEINVIKKGSNYGWHYREGNAPLSSTLISSKIIEPIFATLNKRKSGQRSSLSGGVLYRGYRLLPLRGYYIFADKITREVFAIKYKNNKIIRKYYLGKTNKALISLAVDQEGEIYGLSSGDIFLFSDLKGDEISIAELEEETLNDEE